MTQSILSNEKECYVCHTTEYLHRHHVFEGSAGKDLKAVPSAQPEPKWIPVSERLPEEEDMYKRPQNRYICQMNQAGIFLMLARLRHLGSPMAAFWDWYGKKVPDNDVVAWMPLPEPYKEGEQDGGNR